MFVGMSPALGGRTGKSPAVGGGMFNQPEAPSMGGSGCAAGMGTAGLAAAMGTAGSAAGAESALFFGILLLVRGAITVTR